MLYVFLIKYYKTRRYIKIIIKKSTLIVFIISIIISFSIVNFFENKYRLKPENNSNINVIVKVKSQVDKKEYSNQFTAEIFDKDSNIDKMSVIIEDAQDNKIEYGDILKITGTFQDIPSYKNPGVFNYQEYLKRQHIIGKVKVKKVEKIGKQNNLLKTFSNINRNIKNKIEENFSEDSSSIIKAILLGDKSGINDDILTDVQNNGLSHIIAISGMHISCIILVINLMLNKFIIDTRKKKLISIIFLIIFLLIIGFIVSAVRATIMAILILLSKLLFRKNNFIVDISFASLFILIYNPYYLIDTGFLLSFGATIGIMLIFPKLNKIEPKNKLLKYCFQTLLISVSVSIFILPINILFFKRFSITGIFTTILITPIIFIIEFLGILIIFLPIKIIALLPIKSLVDLIVNIFIKITQISIGTFYFKVPNVFEILIFYLMLIFALNKKIRHFSKVPIIILIIISLISQISFKKQLRLYFVDVEQGDCTLVQTENNKTILIDGGGNENYDVGENVLIPYLLNKKINHIDYLIISHFDTDHVGGLLTVIDKLEVSNIIIGKQFEKTDNLEKLLKLVKNKTQLIVVKKGDSVRLDKNTNLNILWPDDKNVVLNNKINNESLVCKLQYYNFSVLFTGDIEKEAELQIAKQDKILRSTILKVAHHGSNTSSTNELLNAIKPEISLIGVGLNNKYNHPEKEVINRLAKLKSKIYRTDINGEIKIITNGYNYKIKTFVSE